MENIRFRISWWIVKLKKFVTHRVWIQQIVRYPKGSMKLVLKYQNESFSIQYNIPEKDLVLHWLQSDKHADIKAAEP